MGSIKLCEMGTITPCVSRRRVPQDLQSSLKRFELYPKSIGEPLKDSKQRNMVHGMIRLSF